MTLNDLMASTYKDGGRGPVEFDCWGIVRTARHELYGLPLLPSWGEITRHHVKAFSEAATDTAKTLTECRPKPGAIAAVFRANLCTHVGLVVEVEGQLRVLSTSMVKGAYLSRVRDFEARGYRVVYYSEGDK